MRQRVDGWGADGATLGPRLAGRLDQIGLSGFAEAEVGWAGRFRLVPGLRVAGWRQAVAATDAPDGGDDELRWLGTVAPRVRVEARPHDRVTLFGGYGRGYRAPRAVGGVLGALVQAETGQLGLRVEPLADVVLTATAFGTWLDDEAVFDHPSGTFVGAGASRRLGGELDVAVEPLRHLALDASVTFADARFVATGAPVPYAPVWLGRVGLGAHEIPTRLGSVSAGLRTLFLAPRPLPGGFASQGIVSADALLAWTVDRFQVGVQVDNLIGLPWRDGEFVYESWWDLDSPRSRLPAVHLTAGTPASARLWFETRW
jgi:outer membrane receptor protein involved in Fe transport